MKELKDKIRKVFPTITEELLKEYEYYSRLNNSLDRANAILERMIQEKIAQDILGVQPMSASTGDVFTMKGNQVGLKDFTLAAKQDECLTFQGEHYVVDIRPKVEEWLKEQPVHLWKYAEDKYDCHFAFTRVIMTAELYSFLVLRWS